MNPFQRRDDPYMLVVGMTGVKMGDRLAQIGCAHGGRLAAVAGKVGLSGQAVAFVPDEASASRARKAAAQAGVLVDVEIAPATRLPAPDGSFDLAVIDDTDGSLAGLTPEQRAAAVRETFRILRPGGRAIVVGAGRRGGLSALLTRGRAAPPFDPTPAFQGEGFRSVRMLADREGLTFAEAIKPRPAQ
jgi:ubiquinone/menaquinone biosynthesis C-methylase UbiE